MRKFKLLLAILLIVGLVSSVYAATYNFNADGQKGGTGVGDIMGQGKSQAEPHKTFRMVRWMNAGGATRYTASADFIVVWNATASGDDGITVSTTTTTGDAAVAGVLANNVTLVSTEIRQYATDDTGRRNWVWLQTYGLCRVDTQGIVVAGDAMGTGSIAGKAADWIASASDPTVNGNAGFFYEGDSTSSGTENVRAFVRTE